MRTTMKWAAVGGGVMGVTALAAAGLGGAGVSPPSVTANLAVSSTPSGTTGADQAAVAYVNTNYPGQAPASVLATEADVDHGIAVYDVRVMAPNGVTYLIQVQQSNDFVLSAAPAETQPSGTTTAPSTTTNSPTVPPGLTPTQEPTQVTEPAQAKEPAQVTEPAQAKEPAQVTEPAQAKEPAQTTSTDTNTTSTDTKATSTSSDSKGTSSDSKGTSSSTDTNSSPSPATSSDG